MTQNEYSIWFVGDEFATALHLPLRNTSRATRQRLCSLTTGSFRQRYDARDHWSSWPQKDPIGQKALGHGMTWNDMEWNRAERDGQQMLAFLVFHL